MSALLSPPRPVRTRFKVPGEGAYELCADLAPPPSPVYPSTPTTSTTPTSSKPSPQTSLQQSQPTTPPFIAGPLGLTKVTKLSFAERTTPHFHTSFPRQTDLSVTTPDLPLPASPLPPANPTATTSSSTSSMFSFRKLTGLGSSLSAKFSSSTEDEPSQQVTAATASPRPDDGPRFPPRVASAFTGGTPIGTPSATRRGEQARRAFDDPVQNTHHPTSGLLAYNASDAVIVLDMRLHTPAPANAEPTLTLHSRSPPAAQSLHPAGDSIKLLVGCVNGEVLYYPDIVSAGSEVGKKSRTVSAVATLASVAGVMNGSSSPAVPQHFVYNKDGATNSTRVVAVNWVPGSPYRFMSMHDDGAIVVYDARFKPSPGSLRATVGGAANAATGSGSNVNQSTSLSGSTGPNLQQTAPSFDGSGDVSNAGTSIAGSQGAKLNGGLDRANAEKGGDKGDPLEKERERSGMSTGSGDNKGTGMHRRTGSTAGSGGSGGTVGSIGQHDILVTKQAKGKRSNPVAVWQVGKATVTACEFSPVTNGESRLLVITGRDGYLRILDFTKETPLMAFRSYFGAFLCASWSPDGKYVATGGEDDLVSIWCPGEEKLVARLEGHTSWVSAVAWDGSLCGPGRYRLGSAGQDAKLLLWDFALDVLHHRSPQARLGSGIVRRRSYARDPNKVSSSYGSGVGSSSTSSGIANGASVSGSLSSSGVERRPSKLSRLRAHATGEGESGGVGSGGGIGTGSGGYGGTPICTRRVVPALGRAEVAVVEPVVAHVAHGEPLTDVWFEECGVFTADCGGTVKMWSRPAAHAVPELSLEGSAGAAAGVRGGGGGSNRRGGAGDLD